MTVTRYTLENVEATSAFGAALGEVISQGGAPFEPVFLIGPLGAGKTTLARSVIVSLIGAVEVSSPTYPLVQTYTDGALEIWHADLYRLEHEDELIELGLEEAFDTGLVLVEWPDRLGRFAPVDRLEVVISPTDDAVARTVDVMGIGRGERRADALAKRINDHSRRQAGGHA